MPIIDRIASLKEEMTGWRRHLHAHPETAFQEHDTAAFVAERLASFGLPVHRGLARTGVVASLTTGHGPSIGLRADMDALGFQEANDFAHRSTHPGKMHACGHDGHTAMLLGAARYLAETRRFAGTVHFIFQPAEEIEGGGKEMVEDGLFERFPVDAVYGMHNWPELPVGSIAVRPGPIMAACDMFEITLMGRGCHAAMPHLGSDVVLAAGSVVSALHTIVGRCIHPMDAAVVSVTQVHAGETWNVIPQTAVLRGTVRTFKESVQDEMEAAVRRVAEGAAAAQRCTAGVRYDRRYPATVNDDDAADRAVHAAAQVVGADNVDRDPQPSMGSEDFAYMLRARPGCYVWLGNGSPGESRVLHSPHYDFNDEALPIGASYWAALVEQELQAP